jgi:hypothetical protein
VCREVRSIKAAQDKRAKDLPDNPVMDTHFMINLNTQQIHDKFQDM